MSARVIKRLDSIMALLKKMDGDLKELNVGMNASRVEETKSIDSREILNLSASLQKTALALVRLGTATANRVASRTRRSRALESLYLNQLVQLGYAKKDRTKRIVYFSVK